MKTGKLTKTLKELSKKIGKHSPEILTGIGITCMFSAVAFGVKATPKAIELIDEAKYELDTDKLTAVETVKATWKCYIPTALSFTIGMACIVGANSVNSKRNAALATAYKMSEMALTEYKEKVIETIGEKKEQVVRDKVAEQHVKDNPVSNSEVIITDNGSVLCYDTISGRYFMSSRDKIDKAVVKMNKCINSWQYLSLNEFYDAIGLTHIAIGDDMGWNDHIEIYYSSTLIEEGSVYDGQPCLIIDYRICPRYDYRKLY